MSSDPPDADVPQPSPPEPDVGRPAAATSGLSDFELLDTHPNAPRKGPVWLAFALVVASGLMGALIGSSLVGATCSERPPLLQRVLAGAEPLIGAPQRSCTAPQLGGTLAGAIMAAVGTGIVAVLVLRAMAEWRKTPAN